jgi:ComF family protein
MACAPSLPFSYFYMTGERKDELERLLNDFKFNRAYHAHTTLGQLFNASLPELPLKTIVVPIPTIARHRRIRGYDHTDLIAEVFSRLRKLKKERLLRRKTNSVQLGANAKTRRQQAQLAYECPHQLNPDIPYLLLDDIATTGSTLVAAAQCLKKAGAKTIIAAVIARQPLKTEKSD